MPPPLLDASGGHTLTIFKYFGLNKLKKKPVG